MSTYTADNLTEEDLFQIVTMKSVYHSNKSKRGLPRAAITIRYNFF